MITTCLRSAWRAAFGHGGLALTLWIWNAVLALVAGVATWRWFDTAFAYAPESDKLLERFHIGLAIELMQYDRFSPLTLLNGAVLALVVIGAVSNPLVAGGVMEILIWQDRRPALHRFFRGAGHFFTRYLRLLIISAVAALLLFVVVGALTRLITAALGESSWERTWLAAAIGRLVLLGAVVGFVAAVLDIARAQVATADGESRGMLRVWFGAARLAMRHIGVVAALGVSYVVVTGLLIAAFMLVSGAFPARTWVGIAALFVIQQAFMIGRAGLRVARAGAAVEFCRVPQRVSAPVLQP